MSLNTDTVFLIISSYGLEWHAHYEKYIDDISHASVLSWREGEHESRH